MVESTTVDSWMKQFAFISSWSLVETSLIYLRWLIQLWLFQHGVRVEFWLNQPRLISGWNKPNIYAMVDSTMAVLTRGASRIMVDSIAIDLQQQVEFIYCSLTIETKELECWSLAIVLQVQPEMKWNGWCVDEMSACLKSKTDVSSIIINQWRNMYMERACNSASWTNLVEHLWLSPLNMSCITY